MNILLTGGLGFIGSHVAIEILQQTNHQIIIIDDLSNSYLSTFENIKKITGKNNIILEIFSILEKDKLNYLFSKYNIDCIIHFSALKSVPESIEFPSLYYNNNVIGSIYLLDMMIKYNVKKIIFSSSATVYGDTIPPLQEDMHITLQQTNPYGFTKTFVEKIIEDYSKAYSLQAINLRYFNPIGAHPSGLLGENPRKKLTNIFPSIMDVCKGKKEYIEIYGNDYDTEDGSAKRDYIHVCDVANAHFCALQKIHNVQHFENINIGYGFGTSVFQLISIFEKENNCKIPFKILPRRKGDLPIVFCCPDKAKKLLQWTPKYTINDACFHSFSYCK